MYDLSHNPLDKKKLTMSLRYVTLITISLVSPSVLINRNVSLGNYCIPVCVCGVYVSAPETSNKLIDRFA